MRPFIMKRHIINQNNQFTCATNYANYTSGISTIPLHRPRRYATRAAITPAATPLRNHDSALLSIALARDIAAAPPPLAATQPRYRSTAYRSSPRHRSRSAAPAATQPRYRSTAYRSSPRHRSRSQPRSYTVPQPYSLYLRYFHNDLAAGCRRTYNAVDDGLVVQYLRRRNRVRAAGYDRVDESAHF